MKLEDLTFEKIVQYSPLNDRADRYGNVTSWVARLFPDTVAYGNTKKECISEARRYIRNHK